MGVFFLTTWLPRASSIGLVTTTLLVPAGTASTTTASLAAESLAIPWMVSTVSCASGAVAHVSCASGGPLNWTNGRMEAGVTENPDSIDKYLGDFFLSCLPCTAPCATCQQCRAVPKSHWNCLDMETHGAISPFVSDVKILVPPPGGKTM